METEDVIVSGAADYDEFELDEELDELDDGGAEVDEATLQSQQKLRKLFEHHPECQIDYIESILPRINIKTPDSSAASTPALDENHTTFPFLTIYERTAIIGLRAEMLSRGAQAFISVPSYMTDVREIARAELEQKRLPYIVKRPLPNGQYEYWRLADLMII
jgi:DNA-directed RNA polymerase I, II, and III subunit RPABC2